jgi:sulfate transport system permease protein
VTRGRPRPGPPGFRLTLGFTLLYLSLVVLVPVSALVAKSAASRDAFRVAATSRRVLASYGVTFGASLAAAAFDALFGFLVAWVLTRYRFAGRRLADALVDLPLALPTAVAGIALSTLYAPSGWLGRPLAALGVKVSYTPLGIFVALTFLGLPFVVRTLQPVLEGLESDVEEAAASLGAGRRQTFRRVLLPALLPAWLTGFALAFARGLGEYGSVVFIAGNMPMKSEVAPLVVMGMLEQHDLAGATAVAAVLLAASFLLLLGINGLQAWSARRAAA